METTRTLAIIVGCACMVSTGLLVHYLMRVGRRYDVLCFNGLIVTGFCLLTALIGIGSARDSIPPVDLFALLSFSFCGFTFGLQIWREGLRRFRDAG